MSGETSIPELPPAFAALLKRPTVRADVLRGLTTVIAATQARIRQAHHDGAPGCEVMRKLTTLADNVIRTAWRYAQVQYPWDTAPCALVALGGYGRGELNPFSDIDLMFLCQETPPNHVIRDTLYLLWDVGYTLGYSVRTRRDVVHMADVDITAHTAMLEARLIEGYQPLFAWLQEAIGSRHFTPQRLHAFVRHTITECRQRHTTFAHTVRVAEPNVRVVEPNVKESPGGLRDYHTVLWLGTACYQADTVAALVAQGLLTPYDQEALEAAVDFLCRVRNALHYRHGRKYDVLSVRDRMPLATALGLYASAPERAVEALLTTYNRHATVLWHLCQSVMEAVSRTDRPRL
jgi:[protein-PII] uridylyltransferase